MINFMRNEFQDTWNEVHEFKCLAQNFVFSIMNTMTDEFLFQFPLQQSLYLSYHPNHLLLCQFKKELFIYSLKDGTIQRIVLKPNLKGIIDSHIIQPEKLKGDATSIRNMNRNVDRNMNHPPQNEHSEHSEKMYHSSLFNNNSNVEISKETQHFNEDIFSTKRDELNVNNFNISQNYSMDLISKIHLLRFKNNFINGLLPNRIKHHYVCDSYILIDTDATRLLASSIDMSSNHHFRISNMNNEINPKSYLNDNSISIPNLNNHNNNINNTNNTNNSNNNFIDNNGLINKLNQSQYRTWNPFQENSFTNPYWHLLPVNNSFHEVIGDQIITNKRRKLASNLSTINKAQNGWIEIGSNDNIGGKWVSKQNNNELWLLTSTFLKRGILNEGVWTTEEEFNIGPNIEYLQLYSIEDYHPNSFNALFGPLIESTFKSSSKINLLRILFIKRKETIQTTLLYINNSKNSNNLNNTNFQNRDLNLNHIFRWNTFLQFPQPIHSIHKLYTPFHDKDTQIMTGNIFIGLFGCITIVWAFLPQVDKKEENILGSPLTFEVKKHSFYLGCTIESFAIVNHNAIYTNGDGYIRVFPLFDVIESKDPLTQRITYIYNLCNYANIRVLPIQRGVRSVCSHPESLSNHFYYISFKGQLIKSSLINLSSIDHIVSNSISNRRIEVSMDYSVSNLEKLDEKMTKKIAANNALNLRIFEWNCALNIIRWIKLNSNPFTCNILGYLDDIKRSNLKITLKNNTSFPLKDWTLILLLQLLENSTAPRIFCISFPISYLQTNEENGFSTSYPFRDTYKPVKATLFLSFTQPSNILGRSNFCTEIYSSNLSILNFISPVSENNILAYSKILPSSLSADLRASRALLTFENFRKYFENCNNTIQSFQLHVPSLVINRLLESIPKQFVTGNHHLFHIHISKPLKSIENENVYQITALSSNELALHYLRKTLIDYILTLQSEYDQNKNFNTIEEFIDLKKKMNILLPKLFSLKQEIFDFIVQSKFEENEFQSSLEERQELSRQYYSKLQVLYNEVRNLLKSMQLVY